MQSGAFFFTILRSALYTCPPNATRLPKLSASAQFHTMDLLLLETITNPLRQWHSLFFRLLFVYLRFVLERVRLLTQVYLYSFLVQSPSSKFPLFNDRRRRHLVIKKDMARSHLIPAHPRVASLKGLPLKITIPTQIRRKYEHSVSQTNDETSSLALDEDYLGSLEEFQLMKGHDEGQARMEYDTEFLMRWIDSQGAELDALNSSQRKTTVLSERVLSSERSQQNRPSSKEGRYDEPEWPTASTSTTTIDLGTGEISKELPLYGEFVNALNSPGLFSGIRREGDILSGPEISLATSITDTDEPLSPIKTTFFTEPSQFLVNLSEEIARCSFLGCGFECAKEEIWNHLERRHLDDYFELSPPEHGVVGTPSYGMFEACERELGLSEFIDVFWT
ncbi:hypothetical protein CPC08DRAFT_797660 [Agrocybe pediades]|nr:hypothetical protein CPC08DRAFT_797660 [Agrocybe pediades]